MIKAIIFDMDGTILNTIEDITDSINFAFTKNNQKVKTVQEVTMAVGSGAYEMIDELVPTNSKREVIKNIYADFQAHYDTNKDNKTAPYKGIMPLLDNLKKKGYRVAVVSNKHEYLVKELNIKIFNNYFDISIGATPKVPIKPAPDMLYKALKLLKVKKDEVLFIGDSDVDMITATNADLISVGVTWGFRDKEVLIKHKANYIIDKPNGLIEILERIK